VVVAQDKYHFLMQDLGVNLMVLLVEIQQLLMALGLLLLMVGVVVHQVDQVVQFLYQAHLQPH
jgi:hypothetical protein